MSSRSLPAAAGGEQDEHEEGYGKGGPGGHARILQRKAPG